MPVNIIIGLLALFVALVLYSIAAWGAFRAKTASRRHITLILIGVVFDVIATAMMAIQAHGLVNDLHTYLALIALGGMALAGISGAWALSKKHDEMLSTIAKWTLAPWVLWVFVFVWGMMTRGAARMG